MAAWMRWKQDERQTGLAGAFQGPLGHSLHDGSRTYMRVCEATKYSGEWCWMLYRPGKLASRSKARFTNADDAKAAAMAYWQQVQDTILGESK